MAFFFLHTFQSFFSNIFLKCNLPEIDLKRVNILLDDSFAMTMDETNIERIELDQAIRCWEENIESELILNKTRVQICLAIGMVCTDVVQTVGAGDNISGKFFFDDI